MLGGGVTGTTLAAVSAVLVLSGALHAATGFGFALLSAPILAALLGPQEAISVIVITGIVVDGLILGAERRRPEPAWPEAVGLTLWALPGLAAGAYLLSSLPRTGLQLLVAVAVLAGVAMRVVGGRRAAVSGPSARPTWTRAAAGLSSGLLSTATTLGGPPVVLYLMGRRLTPQRMRDTLVVLSLLRTPPSVIALVLAGALRWRPEIPLLWLAVLVGYAGGKWVFTRMDATRYERGVLGLLVLAALTATVVALA
jgi:uncharacterized membrane protein YfcA